MKFILSVISIALLAFVAGVYFPWWTIAIAGFIVALLIPMKPFPSFLAGFFGVFLLWIILAALINTANGNILANRISALLGIGKNPVLLVFFTGFIGGLVAGFAALSASWLHRPSSIVK